jgi:integrase
MKGGAVGKRGNGEGSIYRRKDGRWVGQYTIQTATGQKRRYVYGKTRADVAGKLAKAIAERDAGLTFDAGNLTVSEYLTAWLNDSVRGAVRSGTYRRYEQLCRGHIVPALGNLQLKALSPAHVQRFYRAKLDAGLSPRTVQYMHATLHRALGRAVKWGLIPRNVTEAVDAPRPARRDNGL